MALPVDSFLRNTKRKSTAHRKVSAYTKVSKQSFSQTFRASYFSFAVPLLTLAAILTLLYAYSIKLIYVQPNALFAFTSDRQLDMPMEQWFVYDQAGISQSTVLTNASNAGGLFYTAILGEGIGLSSLAQRYQLSLGTLLSVNHLSSLDESKNLKNIKIPFIDGLLVDVGRDRVVERVARQYAVEESLLRATNYLSQEVAVVSGELFIPEQKMSPSRLRRMIGASYIYPVFGSLSQPFGVNRDAITGLEIYDKGVVFQTQLQAAVLAIADGVLIEKGHHPQFGYYALIDHGEHLAFYAYLQNLVSLNNFAKIKQGELIAQVQQRGHNGFLYFSLIKDSQAVDPINLLR